MPVDVMMFGGHRDGQILEVEGINGVPVSNFLRMTLKPRPFTVAEDTGTQDTLEIIPRIAKTGPRWKIDLPKELW